MKDNWVRDMLKEKLEAKGLQQDEKFNNFATNYKSCLTPSHLFQKQK